MRTHFSIIILAVIMLTTLSACGGGTERDAEPLTDTAAAADTVEPPEPPGDGAAPELRIAMVTSPNVARDGAFNERNYNGVMEFLQDSPDASAAFLHDPDISRALESVQGAVDDGYNAIVIPGFQFAGITGIAAEHPEVNFILIDTFPADAGGAVTELDNVYAVQYREQEGGFLAGLAAALETKTNKVASIGGMPTPPNINYQYGFEAGVHYANKHLGTAAELVSIPAYAGVAADGTATGGNYIGSFNDDSLCRLLAEVLYDDGADIIFVYAGNASRGAFESAINRDGVYVIGAGTDQNALGLAGEKNVNLTTVSKVMGLNVRRALEAIADGTFRGGNHRLGIDSDSVEYEKSGDLCMLSDNTVNKLEEIIPLLKTGAIIPPGSSDGGPDSFPGL